MVLWAEVALGQGQDIPDPISAADYSGRFTLRLPPSLHQRADLLARVEGISLNRFLSAAVAAYTGEVAARTGERALEALPQYEWAHRAQGDLQIISSRKEQSA